MSGNKYETVNTQVECEDTLHPNYDMFICQEMIEEVTDAEAVIMTQVSLKEGMKCWKGKRQSAAKYETNQLNFRENFKPKHYRDLNEYQKNMIFEFYMFLKEKRESKIKVKTVIEIKKQRYFISKEYYIYGLYQPKLWYCPASYMQNRKGTFIYYISPIRLSIQELK